MAKENPAIGLGITFSHTHLNYLDCVKPPDSPPITVGGALERALGMGFSHIRFGSYWREVEIKPGVYNFSVLEGLLDRCEGAGQGVIMNVGVKSPQYPEFYWPTYLEEKNLGNPETRKRTLLFTKECVGALKKFTCITHWQVENEPLDPTGDENVAIPLDFLKEEVGLVRSLDSRPILLTLWGKTLKSRQLYPQIFDLADMVGIDLYYRGSGKSYTTSGPRINHAYVRRFVETAPKPVIISELQAEPWEINVSRYLSKNPKSISPELLESNLKKASSLGVKEIILWGYEYWYYRESQGDSRYLEVVKRHLKSDTPKLKYSRNL